MRIRDDHSEAPCVRSEGQNTPSQGMERSCRVFRTRRGLPHRDSLRDYTQRPAEPLAASTREGYSASMRLCMQFAYFQTEPIGG